MNVPMEKKIRHHVEEYTINMYSVGVAGSVADVAIARLMARDKFP